MSTVRGTVRKKYMTEEDSTVCRECGKTYKLLGKHVVTHGLSPRDYKLKYGFPLTVGLCSSSTFDKFSQTKQQLFKDQPMMLVRLLLSMPPGARAQGHRAEGKLSENLPVRAKAYRDQCAARSKAIWDSRKDEFIKLWKNGVTIAKMAEHFGCKPSSIRNHRREWNLPAREMKFVLANE